MATPSAQDPGAPRGERRARLPSPAILASGAALTVAALWLVRTPVAENWARGFMLERHLDSAIKIKRLDLTGIEIDEFRLGSEKAPGFEADSVRVKFVWKAPWKVELDDIQVERAHWVVGWNESGPDFRGVEALFNRPAPEGKKGGGLVVRRFSAPNAVITFDSKFGTINARGALSGDLAAKNYGANFQIEPGRMRGPGLNGRLLGGALSARVVGDALTANAELQAGQVASAALDAKDVTLKANLSARGFGGALDNLVGALDVTARGAGVNLQGETIEALNFVARAEKSDGPVDRVSWKADATDLGGAWVIAPSATFAGGFSGALPINARLDGRGGWTFNAPEARFGEETRRKIQSGLIDGNWPDPLKAPFAAAGESFLVAGQDLTASASGDIIAAEDGLTFRVLRADSEARSGAVLNISSTAAEGVLSAGPKGLSGQGQLNLSGGGAPPLFVDLQSLKADSNGWAAQANVQLADWRTAESDVALNLPSVTITGAKGRGVLNVSGGAFYSGPIAGGQIEKLSLKLPARVSWAPKTWTVETTECVRLSAESWKGSGIETGAFAAAPCAAGGVIARSQNGQLSGRSDWTNISVPARAGEKANAPELLLSAERASLDLRGTSHTPRALISIPNAVLQIMNWSEEDQRDVTTIMDAQVFTIELAPSDAGMTLDMQTSGVMVDLDGTTVEVADLAASMKGVMAPEGLNAEITGITGLLRDPGPAPAITDIALTGEGASVDGKITLDMLAQPVRGGPPLATIRITHNIENGAGRALANTGEMRFAAGRQPQTLFPVLQGLIADVRGAASGVADARWGEAGFTTRGELNLDNLEFSTFSLGPVQGVSGKIRFDDLLNPSTQPSQRIEIKTLNPGVLAENVSLNFELQSRDQMRIEGGEAKIVGGTFIIEPVTWKFGPQRQDFAMLVQDAPIDQILKLFNNPDFKGSGVLRGRIPISLEKGQMRVNHARFEAVGDGELQVNVPPGTAAAADNKFVTLAFDALRDLKFSLLALDVDGDVAGRLENKLTIRGKSPSASNLPFAYNISVSAPILPLMQQARYIYDKSAIGDYTRNLDTGAVEVPVTIDAAPVPKE